MSFQQGLSGLNAASKSLDAISNNISNSDTAGFKSADARFADVFAASLSGGGGSQIGVGVGLDSVFQKFTQGNITTTGNPLDLAINGQGMFRLSENGSVTYSRNGQFNVDKTGYIVSGSGSRLTGYNVDTTGAIVPGSFTDLQVDTSNIAPAASTSTKVLLSLDSRQPAIPALPAFDPTITATYTASTAQTV